jgi:hypothetical protein
MVLDKQGNPLLAFEERRDEFVRCMGIIGWTWPKVAERLGITYPGSMAIKNCKRQIADSDLRWLQELADAVAALPRPAIANDPSPDVARLGAPVTMPGAGMSDEMVARMTASAASKAAGAEQARTVETLAAVYFQAASSELGEGELSGVRWAISEMAERLNLVAEVREAVRAKKPEPEPAAPPSGAWSPPVPEPESRVPFGD